jgi:phage baseplate assembly protein W
MAGALASAFGLQGNDSGAGTVALRWSYADDIVAQNITFDVFAMADPLDPFRLRAAADVAALSATVGGFEQGGNVFFTVVAKRGAQLSLPSSILRVAVQPVRALASTTAPTTAEVRPASGLRFPFQIDALGSVSGDDGDPLLRGKILQLLLTSPGERVNLPDYGTRLRDLVFDPNSDVLAATTEFMIRRTLQKFLRDEIDVDQVGITNTDDRLEVTVVYLRKSNLRLESVLVGIPLPA